MPSEATVSEFDKLMSELMAAPEVGEAETTTTSEPIKLEVIGSEVKLVPTQPVVATSETKPVPASKYRTDDGKQEIQVEAPFTATMYSKGYLNMAFGQSWNKAALYKKKFLALREFMRSEKCDELIAQADALGWKDEPSKKGG